MLLQVLPGIEHQDPEVIFHILLVGDLLPFQLYPVDTKFCPHLQLSALRGSFLAHLGFSERLGNWPPPPTPEFHFLIVFAGNSNYGEGYIEKVVIQKCQ